MKTRVNTLSESAARNLMYKFQPIVYLHKSEQYFPSKIKDFHIDWPKTKLLDKTATALYSYTGPAKFDNSAPMLVSIYQNTDGTARISYVFLYAFNGCGPKAKVHASLIGLKVNDIINLCPADKHYGDIEHIEVTLNPGYNSIKKIKYAFHQWSKTYTSDGTQDGKISDHVKFSGNQPLVYAGLGSHASYSTPGDQYYYTVFSKSGKGYSASLQFIDYAGDTSGHKWTGSARLLKLNGSKTSDITLDEEMLAFKFYGALGPEVHDKTANTLVNVLNKIKKVANTLKISKIKNACADAIKQLNTYFQATGVTGLASPTRSDWW